MMRVHRSVLALLYAGVVLGMSLEDVSAQRKSKNKDAWKKDPYTEGEADRLAKAGYVSLGPFAWGDNHDTLRIEHVLGEGVKLLWLETEHFKIGSSLPPYKIPRVKTEQKKLRAELTRLKKKLPKVKPRAKVLDRWLRLHLFAQRFEETYTDFCERMDVKAEDFPAVKGQLVNGRYMGEGPYLGQPAKFTILLFEKKVSCGHYLRNFLGIDDPGALRHNSLDTGSLLYVTSTEFAHGTLRIDTALHCEAVFNCVHSLVDGYRYYQHSLPHWFRQGLAHWYLRRISPKYNVYNEETRYDNQPEKLWNWPPRVRARVKFDHFPPASELVRWRKDQEKKLVDSMMVWSRMDYLMSLGDEGLRTYIHLMSEPFGGSTRPTRDQILERQTMVLKKAWGLDVESFDGRWRDWVLANYPEK